MNVHTKSTTEYTDTVSLQIEKTTTIKLTQNDVKNIILDYLKNNYGYSQITFDNIDFSLKTIYKGDDYYDFSETVFDGCTITYKDK